MYAGVSLILRKVLLGEWGLFGNAFALREVLRGRKRRRGKRLATCILRKRPASLARELQGRGWPGADSRQALTVQPPVEYWRRGEECRRELRSGRSRSRQYECSYFFSLPWLCSASRLLDSQDAREKRRKMRSCLTFERSFLRMRTAGPARVRNGCKVGTAPPQQRTSPEFLVCLSPPAMYSLVSLFSGAR